MPANLFHLALGLSCWWTYK